MAQPMQSFVPPVGNLMWAFITGNGKKNLQDKDVFTCSVEYKEGSEEHKAVEKMLEDFWEENKPKGAKLKSNGLSIVKDKEGNPTGMVSLQFWTGTTLPDGKKKSIKVYNAKGAEVSLGNKRIGNGSRGTIPGKMSIYDQGAAARGITLFLGGVQITKFVPYNDTPDLQTFDDEDAWTGEGDLDEAPPAQAEASEGSAESNEAPARVSL